MERNGKKAWEGPGGNIYTGCPRFAQLIEFTGTETITNLFLKIPCRLN